MLTYSTRDRAKVAYFTHDCDEDMSLIGLK